MARQMERYRKESYPKNNGLCACTILLRRHNSPDIIEAMENWWQEISNGSFRDQLSFNYIAHKCGLEYGIIPGHVYKSRKYFSYKKF
jgi:hypothetical protein